MTTKKLANFKKPKPKEGRWTLAIITFWFWLLAPVAIEFFTGSGRLFNDYVEIGPVKPEDFREFINLMWLSWLVLGALAVATMYTKLKQHKKLVDWFEEERKTLQKELRDKEERIDEMLFEIDEKDEQIEQMENASAHLS